MATITINDVYQNTEIIIDKIDVVQQEIIKEEILLNNLQKEIEKLQSLPIIA